MTIKSMDINTLFAKEPELEGSRGQLSLSQSYVGEIDYLTEVEGDGAEPEYFSGDFIGLKEVSEFKDGEFYSVKINGERKLRKVYQLDEGLALIRINPKYTNEFVSYESGIQIMGKVTVRIPKEEAVIMEERKI